MSNKIKTIWVFPGKPMPTKNYPKSVIMVAMDGDTGDVLHTHHSTDVHWGLKDIGIVQPGTSKGTRARKRYAQMFPNGYQMKRLADRRAGHKKYMEIIKQQKEGKR